MATRLGVHLPGEHSIFLCLTLEQLSELLVTLQLLVGFVELCLELFDLVLQVA